MGKLNECITLIEVDDLLEKHNTIRDKVSADIKKEFDSGPVCNKEFLKPKLNLMVIKLHIFMIKTFLKWTQIILV